MIPALERAKRYVARIDGAVSGQRGHDATFHVAACLVNGFALSQDDALSILHEWNGKCVPPWSERELFHKVESASKAQHACARGHLLGEHQQHANFRSQISNFRTATPGPAKLVSPRAAAEKFLKGFRCDEAELAAQSPVSLDGDPRFDGVVALENLYKPGERINFVTDFDLATEKSGETKARPVGRGIIMAREKAIARFGERGSDCEKGGAWLRMNPVDGNGVADANVTAFRYALLESDALPLELQISLIARLSLPIAMVVSSGGRSVHAWVRVDAGDIAAYRATAGKLLKILARLGFDEKNKNPSRLSRLPGAKRVIGAVGDGLQKLLYLNPNPTERSICP